jgi:hypothetical protein
MKQIILVQQLFFFCLCLLGIQVTHSRFTVPAIVARGRPRCSSSHETQIFQSVLQEQPPNPGIFKIRGGADDDDGEEEESDEEEEEQDDDEDESPTGVDVSFVIEKVGSLSKRAMVIVGKVAVQTANAFQRGIQAGLHGEEDDDEDDAPIPITAKVLKVVKRMIKAALTFPTDEDEDEAEETVVETGKKTSKKAASSSEDGEDDEEESEEKTPKQAESSLRDFGSFLAKSYGVSDQRGEDGPIMLGGHMANALTSARAEARMLVVFIPGARPSSKAKKSKDQLAIESVLSSEVEKAGNKRARKVAEGMGSFMMWGAKMGSSEATTAIKRLKNVQMTSSTGEKRPILAVVYPGQVSEESRCVV